VLRGVGDVAATAVSGERVGKESELGEADVGGKLAGDKGTVISEVQEKRRDILIGREVKAASNVSRKEAVSHPEDSGGQLDDLWVKRRGGLRGRDSEVQERIGRGTEGVVVDAGSIAMFSDEHPV
jgi:hypothetical protein